MKNGVFGNLFILPFISLVCAGCLGYSLDTPVTVEVRKPIPLTGEEYGDNWGSPNRWACESQSAAYSPLSKADFLEAWGEPEERIISADGETWIYEESGRWCGLWLGAIIPVPLVLPACETFDYVYFEGEIAVSTHSRRFTRSTAGVILFLPQTGFIPVPVSVRPGKVTENRANIHTFDNKETRCGF